MDDAFILWSRDKSKFRPSAEWFRNALTVNISSLFSADSPDWDVAQTGLLIVVESGLLWSQVDAAQNAERLGVPLLVIHEPPQLGPPHEIP